MSYTKFEYIQAEKVVEELINVVNEDTSISDSDMIKFMQASDVVEKYENKYFKGVFFNLNKIINK